MDREAICYFVRRITDYKKVYIYKKYIILLNETSIKLNIDDNYWVKIKLNIYIHTYLLLIRNIIYVVMISYIYCYDYCMMVNLWEIYVDRKHICMNISFFAFI